MPPISPNRSGKSTPTNRRPIKEEEKLIQDEEEEKLRNEQLEKERKEKEVKAKQEAERLEALNEIRDKQELETFQELEKIKDTIQEIVNDRRANAEWERYMRCDGKPDPTSVKEINTFIALTKQKANPDINVALEEAKLILVLINELKFLLDDSVTDSACEEAVNYKHTILSLQDLLMVRYNNASLKLLKEASYEADSETGNLQKVINGDNEVMMLWGNLNKNPRFKSYEFEDEKLQFELPKVLAMADISVRVLKTKFDHYSHQCTSFLPKIKKKVDPVAVGDPNVEEEAAPEAAEENEDAEDTKSNVTDGRKSGMSQASGKGGEEKEEGVDAGAEVKDEPPDEKSEVKVALEDVELDDILDPDVVDLRQYSPLGGVYHIDLLQMPPQPKVVKGWTLTQIIDKPLTNVKYPSETNFGRTPSRTPSAAPEGRDEGATPTKTPLDQQQPPIGITMKLPSNVMFFEEPQVALWDKSDLHWKTTGVTDLNFDEVERVLSFKTNEFGIFNLSQDAHLNMPFQSWELRPKGVDAAVLTVTAAIAEAEIEIKGGQCRLNPPEEDPPKELSHIFDKWMSADQLIDTMKRAGVNLFPASDSHKFVSIQEKEIDVDHIYAQMSAMSSSFAFSWSKWNNDSSKNIIIMQAAPFYVTDDVASRGSVPDDDWSTFAVGDDRCYKLAITEFEDQFDDVVAPGTAYHYDIMHAMRMTSLRDDPDGKLLASLYERSASADHFFVHAVQTLLKATKVITFS